MLGTIVRAVRLGFHIEQCISCYVLHESLGRLEGGNVVLGNDNGGILGNITSRLLCTLFQDEATETTEVNVFLIDERVLNRGHKGFYNYESGRFIYTSLLGDIGYDVCFSHIVFVLVDFKKRMQRYNFQMV